MGDILGPIEMRGGAPALRAGGPALADIERQLRAGEGPETLGLEAKDFVAALAFLALGPEDSEGPPLVQAEPSRPWLADALGPEAMAALLPQSEPTARLALAAGLLQVHGFWEASHHAAQEADDRGERRASAYWHGIAHRREPDPGNAAYWFRRVGRHALYPRLAESAGRIIAAEPSPPRWALHCVTRGAWDPIAFGGACSSVAPGSAEAGLACRFQRLEMALLLGHSLDACLE